MPDKYITLGVNGQTEVAFTAVSTGASDAGKGVATGTDGKLDQSLFPNGMGADVRIATAYEALSAGDLVNLFSDSGTLKARKANAASGVAYSADGFVQAAVASGQQATVYCDGTISGLSSLTVGAKYYLSATTAGGVTTTIPSTAGQIYQSVGKAASATELIFEIGETILRA